VRAVSPTRPTHLLGVALTMGLALPVMARAQEGCEFGEGGNDVVNSVTLPGLGRVTYITRPHFVCQGGVDIWADSAVAYGDRGMSHLIGTVRYLEEGRELLADEARYFTNEGRLQAEGHMSIRDEVQGSSIRNGDLVYLLETEFRDEASMAVTTGADGIRPLAELAPPPREASPDSVPSESPPRPDTIAAPDSVPVTEVDAPEELEPDTLPPTPYTVQSDRMFLRGEGFFTAAGAVEIVRDSLFAFGDSAEYDRELGDLVLEGSARVEGEGYELVGRRVQMASPAAASSRVEARREARLVGEGFDLTAARIVIFLRDDALERLVAVPIVRAAPGVEVADSADLERPNAFVQDFVLTSDSLEILAPGESIERVFAAGHAYSASTSGDSLNVDLLPDIARSDWLEGDTIVIAFEPDPDAQAPSDVVVEAITALVGARSLYRLPANDSTAVPGTDPPAVHYVTGDSIRIELSDGEVRQMRVSGQTRGVHLEPLRRPPADTAATSDSIRVGTDTASAVTDTGSVAGRSGEPGSTPRRRDRTRGRNEREPERTFREEVPWIRH
jgi:lipopolysaccharide export system protein LptA